MILAQKAMRAPETLSMPEIRSLAASVISQAKPGPMARLKAVLSGASK